MLKIKCFPMDTEIYSSEITFNMFKIIWIYF